jgi:indole-3-glycerol phosphate synthase
MFQLDALLANKEREVARKKKLVPRGDLERIHVPAVRDFAAAIREPGVSLIAEMKRKSPSAGAIQPSLDPAANAAVYESAGARALSVLTDREYFGGREEDVLSAKSACRLPVLRKEFILDEYQVVESRAIGADAVLLIVRILSRNALRKLLASAESMGMECLVEIHAEPELDEALDAGASIVGVNNRNLATLSIDLRTSLRLAERIPEGVLKVSESGIRTAEEVRTLVDAGFDALLVGETILRAGDLGAKIRELTSRSA